MVCITVWQKVPASTTQSMDCSVRDVKETLTFEPLPLGAFQQGCDLLVSGHVETQKCAVHLLARRKELHLASDNQANKKGNSRLNGQEVQQLFLKKKTSTCSNTPVYSHTGGMPRLLGVMYCSRAKRQLHIKAAGIQTFKQIGFGKKVTTNTHPGTEIWHHHFHATFFQK